MRDYYRSLCLGLLVLGGLLLARVNPACADHPLAGKWLIKGYEVADLNTFWLVDVKEKKGKLTGELLDTSFPVFKQAKVEDVRGDKTSLHMALSVKNTKFSVHAYVPKGAKETKNLLGSVSIGSNLLLVKLERTKEKEIDPKTAREHGPAAEDFKELGKAKTRETVVSALRKFLKKHPERPITVLATKFLFRFGKKSLSTDEFAKYAKSALGVAEKFGPEAKQATIKEMIALLLQSDKGSKVALDYARQLKAALPKDATNNQRYDVFKILLAALKKNKKMEEVQQVQAELAKLGRKLDEEFEKKNISFKLQNYAGRKKGSKRVVVVELFTGAQCPPCVSADIAFDALLKTFNPKQVALLQYHLHIPGPDPLANKTTEDRAEYYNVNGTPYIFINGKNVPKIGGYREHGEARYETMMDVLKKDLEEKADAKLDLNVSRSGDEIKMTAKVSDLAKTGKNARLRFIVFEDVVHYVGSNGQRLHQHVVRAMPAGQDGIAMEEKSGTYTATLNVAKLRTTLTEYLHEYAKIRPFPNEDRPLKLGQLYVVALVQTNDDQAILQAVQAEVPKGK